MVQTFELPLSTHGDMEIVEITTEVSNSLADSKLQNGILTIFSPSSTSGLTTIEYEPGCVKDLQEVFERIIPENQNYNHNTRWADGNGHSHARSALLGVSLTVPFVKGKLALGNWQQIIFVDFDNKLRRRTLIVQIMGE